jgi:hypothetical protein
MQFIDSQHKNLDMAIVVVSYDGYSDLWDDFFYLLNKFWQDRPFPVYLVNNSKKPKYPNITVINCGEEAQWSTRSRIAIEQLQEKYICLLLEDYFIGSKIDTKLVIESLELMKRESLHYYKLNNFSKVKTKLYKNTNHLQIISQNLKYGISLQAAIWERDYLLECIGSGDYNAWRFELDRINESLNTLNEPIEGCVYDNRNILNIYHGVAKGKFLPPAVKYFKKQNYYLNIAQRDIMSSSEYMSFWLKGIGNSILPEFSKKYFKKVMTKFGMKFLSNK